MLQVFTGLVLDGLGSALLRNADLYSPRQENRQYKNRLCANFK